MIAYAPFAHGNDLGNGLVVYPVWAISAALLTLIATIIACNADARETCCFEEKSRRPFKKSRIREVFFFSACYTGHVTRRSVGAALSIEVWNVREGDAVDESALKELIRAAVAYNGGGKIG